MTSTAAAPDMSFLTDDTESWDEVEQPTSSGSSVFFFDSEKATFQLIDVKSVKVFYGRATVRGEGNGTYLRESEVEQFKAQFNPEWDPSALYIARVVVFGEDGSVTPKMAEIKATALSGIRTAADASECENNELVLKGWKEGTGRDTEYKVSAVAKPAALSADELTKLADEAELPTAVEFITNRREQFKEWALRPAEKVDTEAF